MKHRKIDTGNADPDMTPMIDIVFQLLTFFMIVINFENTKADERVKLPIDALAKPPESKLENELVLNIGFNRTKEGNIVGDPVIFYNSVDIPLEKIGFHLDLEAKTFRAKSPNPEKALDDVAVNIRADAAVPTGFVQELIEKCQEAKFTKFSLKASQKQE
jgi:biopolymer transport protein ExbD